MARRLLRFAGIASAFAALGLLAFGCATAAATPCQFNSDCTVGFCGPDKTCTRDCVISSRDCPKGTFCDRNAQCVPTGGSAGTAGGSNAGGDGPGPGPSSSSGAAMNGGGGTGGASTGGSGPGPSSSSNGVGAGGPASSSSSSTSSGVGGSMNLHALDLCGADADCDSAEHLVCRPLFIGSPSRCTPTCTSSATCMTGTVCETIAGTEFCAGDDVGAACTAAAGCNFGCLTGPGYCTIACATGSDCPNGYGCEGVGSPAVRVCVQAEAACDPSDATACIGGPSACDVGSNMVVGGCTLACSSATDCPQRAAGLPPWTCDGLCRRPSDVSGPLPTGYTPAQYACNGLGDEVNVCNDGLHIDFDAFTIPNPPSVSCSATTTTDGSPGDACVDSCRYEGGCPFGSACVAVGDLGGRVGLCLPTGAGEVGTSCAEDGDCVFGYCVNSVCSRDCSADGVCPGGTMCVAGGAPPVEGLPFRRCQ